MMWNQWDSCNPNKKQISNFVEMQIPAKFNQTACFDLNIVVFLSRFASFWSKSHSIIV